MKLTTIAKATLALGILTTGVFTAESQTGSRESRTWWDTTQILYQYATSILFWRKFWTNKY